MGAHDYYLLHLARLGNPDIVRISDLGSGSHIRLTHTALDPVPPVDALVSPSHFVSSHRFVVDEHVPAYVTPCSVDTTAFQPRRSHPLYRHLATCLGWTVNRDAANSVGTRRATCAARLALPLHWYAGPEYDWDRHTSGSESASESRQQPVVFAYIARVSSEKGFALYLSAARDVADAMPNARFLLVGGSPHGNNERALTALVAAYNLTALVRFA